MNGRDARRATRCTGTAATAGHQFADSAEQFVTQLGGALVGLRFLVLAAYAGWVGAFRLKLFLDNFDTAGLAADFITQIGQDIRLDQAFVVLIKQVVRTAQHIFVEQGDQYHPNFVFQIEFFDRVLKSCGQPAGATGNLGFFDGITVVDHRQALLECKNPVHDAAGELAGGILGGDEGLQFIGFDERQAVGSLRLFDGLLTGVGSQRKLVESAFQLGVETFLDQPAVVADSAHCLEKQGLGGVAFGFFREIEQGDVGIFEHAIDERPQVAELHFLAAIQ